MALAQAPVPRLPCKAPSGSEGVMKDSILKTLFLLSVSRLSDADSSNIANVPLFLTQAVQPAVMLNLPKDSQAFNRLYDDYSDLNNDGIPETGYTHGIDYQGYFDPYKCYGYQNNHFYPVSFADGGKYCRASWSGNFLNWASMTRIDLIRKIIYGGMRSSQDESASNTVLERSYLPPDAHSFAKFYQGSDLNRLTPYNFSEGITLCNLTSSSSLSQNSSDPPLIRIAKGSFSLWAANERWQCQWFEERHDLISAFILNQGSNGNQALQSGFSAGSENPSNSSIQPSSYQAKVQVCVPNLIDPNQNNEHCKLYQSGFYKPSGLLQKYGDDDRIHFGLMTGSYAKSKSGGVLRKNISSVSDEIDGIDGHFKTPTSGGIIDAINHLTLFGYDHQTGLYFGVPGSADCIWGMNSFNDGICQNWGNPQSEMFLESLRFFAGKTPSSSFNTDDSSLISGFTPINWLDPIQPEQWCRNLNVIQFNAGTASYDADQLNQAIDINLADLNGQTNLIGVKENIAKSFIGSTAQNNDQTCTAKNIDSLSQALGICPDSPGLEGSYQLAGLASYAYQSDIRSDIQNNQTVNFYGVNLNQETAAISVPMQGGDIKIMPACKNSSTGTNCRLMDIKRISQDDSSGKFHIVWEDSEQGGDFDSDLNGVLNYKISGNQLIISTQVIAYSSTFSLGFGYVISGSSQDGFHAHSGINSFKYNDSSGVLACDSCQYNDAPSQWTYNQTGTSATLMRPPLFYASKWSGYSTDQTPANYFDITLLSKLDSSLDKSFQNASQTYASATSITLSSRTVSDNTLVYQARFNSTDWSGQLLAFAMDQQGNVSSSPVWDAATQIPSYDNRKLFSYDGNQGIEFKWTQGLTLQQRKQIDAAHANASSSPILNYLSGDQSQETKQGGIYRDRNSLLGDIVHSNPLFVGIEDYAYSSLPGSEGLDYAGSFRSSAAYQHRKKMVYLGANDGMLHGFDALNGKEIFAYVPSNSLLNQNILTGTDYGSTGNPHRYFVDGIMKASDAYLGIKGKTQWKTVLVGSLGAGGIGIFALDITDPENFDQDNVLWEFSQDNDLGYGLPEPAIARLSNGQWGAVISNGYESPNKKAVLFIIDIATGKLIKKIDTGAGSQSSPNGLSSPIVIDVDGDKIADAVYAGDLQGNLWKFDVTCPGKQSCEKQWAISTSNKNPLFAAKDASGHVQAITAKPQVSQSNLDPSSFMVYFGTGRYFANGDNLPTANPATQSFYGILDDGSTTASRSALVQQSILKETALGNATARITSNNPVDYQSKKGWYMDLTTPGERVISNPRLSGGRIIFSSLIPATDSCSFGGYSWLMELDAFTGSRVTNPAFDLNGPSGVADGFIDSNDRVVSNNASIAPSGKKSSVGMTGTPAVIADGNKEYKLTSGTSGMIEKTAESKPNKSGRTSWQQLH